MLDNVKNLITQLTLEEKAKLCSGRDFWTTKPILRLDVPSIALSDGPHGLRKENDLDNSVGMKASFPATSFPPAVNLASSWNPSLAYSMGEALADQCKEKNVSVILGPGTNMKRSPLCGRNFEYLSEDPFLAGKICRQYIDGVQDNNVGTSLKHFCANNQEKLRMSIDAIIDERTLREIYLPSFEEAVKSQPASVMCAYNRLNGVYLSDKKQLLTDILRTEWGFQGIVVSDWNATNDRVEGIRAGMDLEMPSSGGANDKLIVKAVQDGLLDIADLDKVVERLLEFVIKYDSLLEKNHTADFEKAHKIACKIAEESIVLLKNQNDILPLEQTDDTIAIIGDMAKNLRYQGSGSSRINPYKLVSFTQHLDDIGAKYEFAPAYNKTGDNLNEELFNNAIELAKKHKQVILFVGLTDDYESEGYDRSHLNLPSVHEKLITTLLEINPNTIVVLSGGSPVSMPWLDKVSGLLNAYLPGEAGGEAIYNILYGKVNPSGKLAETYPLALEDFIGSQYYPMGPKTVEYREGIFIGYRYYDTANKKVLFPFGFGLSYTQFEYSNLRIEGMTASFVLKNIGQRDGAEISQLYIRDCAPKVFKANKELKGFAKTFLKKGESKIVVIELNERSFSFYNTATSSWTATNGEYEIIIGASVEDCKLSSTLSFEFESNTTIVPDYKASCPTYFDIANAKEIPTAEFTSIYGKVLPTNLKSKRGEFDRNTTIGELSCCLIGKIIIAIAPAIIKSQVPNADITTLLMMKLGMEEMPLRGLNGITQGILVTRFIDGMILWGNKHRMRGFGKMFVGILESLKNIARKDKDFAVRKEAARIEKEKEKVRKAEEKIRLDKEKELEKQQKLDDKVQEKAQKLEVKETIKQQKVDDKETIKQQKVDDKETTKQQKVDDKEITKNSKTNNKN